MTVKMGPLIVDAVDPPAVEAFWAAAIGPDAQRRYLRFRPEREPKTVKNRVHLDLAVDEWSGVTRLVALGAQVLADHLPGWVTMADVEGNEFCAFPTAGTGAPARLFAVCTDSDRPEALAEWWSRRVGARVGPGPDQTPRWLYDSPGWEELIWKFVRVADPRTCANRWRWSVTGSADELIAAGAVALDDGELADPAGNDFSAAGPTRSAG